MRSTSATRMYNANVDEQMIKDVTGHNSNAVRIYKNTSDDMHRDVSGKIQSYPKAMSTVSVPPKLDQCDVKIDSVDENKGVDCTINAKPSSSKCDKVHKSDNTSTCEMLQRMIDSRKYKKVRLSVELSDD